jgi:hypothetical protein
MFSENFKSMLFELSRVQTCDFFYPPEQRTKLCFKKILFLKQPQGFHQVYNCVDANGACLEKQK